MKDFERFLAGREISNKARQAQIDTYKAGLPEATVVFPRHTRRTKRAIYMALPVAAALAVLEVACGAAAARELPKTLPEVGDKAPTVETTQIVVEVNILKEMAQKIGVPAREDTGGLVRFERIISEPKGEVLYFPPDSLIGQYASLDLRSVAGGLYIDTFLSVRDGLINRALQANAALASGDQTKALDELEALKKRIEVQSRGDERSITEVAMDKNNNGITDYLEPFYSGVRGLIVQLTPGK